MGDIKEQPLNNKWIIWRHVISNTNWKLDSFDKLFEINSIYDFWCFFANLENINFRNNTIYIMRDNITPLWEDPKNRNGGTCSIRIEKTKVIPYITELCAYMVNEFLLNDDDDLEINGMSITSYGNWTYIKILNKNKEINPSKYFNDKIKNKYEKFSVVFKQNVPEYEY
jgi:hypothetical protein